LRESKRIFKLLIFFFFSLENCLRESKRIFKLIFFFSKLFERKQKDIHTYFFFSKRIYYLFIFQFLLRKLEKAK
jgi:hypothetical protein